MPNQVLPRSIDQAASANSYAEWVQERSEAYRAEGIRRLREGAPKSDVVMGPLATEEIKRGKWRMAVDVAVTAGNLESHIDAVERVPVKSRGMASEFVPLRFTPFNKVTRHDRLLLAFDALVLSEVIGRTVSKGKIIHGDDHSTLPVKFPGLVAEVRALIQQVATRMASPAPDLVLNRHCGECEFRDHCRQRLIEKDDLSLLATMSPPERKKYHSQGIFTVTQLSYTFRPRRRPKHLRDKREKFHYALKALAVREKKIYVVGKPELTLQGTPVYLDVEGLGDREFYYLIGVRIGAGDTAVHHSFWADDRRQEQTIWTQLQQLLAATQDPVLIHYGSYEATFLKCMVGRYGGPKENTSAAQALNSSINLLSFIYGQ